jgi:hypothetical protein
VRAGVDWWDLEGSCRPAAGGAKVAGIGANLSADGAVVLKVEGALTKYLGIVWFIKNIFGGILNISPP